MKTPTNAELTKVFKLIHCRVFPGWSSRAELPGGMVLLGSHAWFPAVRAVGQLFYSHISQDLSVAAAFVGRKSHLSSRRIAISAPVQPEHRSIPN